MTLSKEIMTNSNELMNILSEKQMRLVIVGATGMVGGYPARGI
jgi:hypothetical protein